MGRKLNEKHIEKKEDLKFKTTKVKYKNVNYFSTAFCSNEFRVWSFERFRHVINIDELRVNLQDGVTIGILVASKWNENYRYPILSMFYRTKQKVRPSDSRYSKNAAGITFPLQK